MVRLSARRTGRLYPQGKIPVTHSGIGCVDPRALVRPGGLSRQQITLARLGIELATFRLVAKSTVKNNDNIKMISSVMTSRQYQRSQRVIFLESALHLPCVLCH
jgi:hypothetical protein